MAPLKGRYFRRAGIHPSITMDSRLRGNDEIDPNTVPFQRTQPNQLNLLNLLNQPNQPNQSNQTNQSNQSINQSSQSNQLVNS